jgi:hypothetical protein
LGKRKHVDMSEMVVDALCDKSAAEDQENLPNLPSTPKRQCRRAPTHIPFGLERADFYNLATTPPGAEEVRAETNLDTPMGDEDHEETTPKALPQTPACLETPLHSSAFCGPGSLTPRPSQRRSPRLNMNFSTEPAGDPASTEDGEDSGHDWSEEDDRQLVELVLEKLRLSRRAWNECARQLGADQRSLGMRWKFLVDEGQVGLKLRKGGKQVRGQVKGLWS